jgi:hypothetical protein
MIATALVAHAIETGAAARPMTAQVAPRQEL